MRRLPTALIAAVSVVAFTQSAVASDWTGFYIGANVGYGWNNSSATESPGDSTTGFLLGGQTVVGPASMSFDTKGWAGGFQAGYNWQFNPRWLAGVEADFNWSNIKGNNSAPANIISQSWGISVQARKWIGSAPSAPG